MKGLLDQNAILVINKSDLLKGDIDPEIKKLNHVLISIKDNLNIDELILKIKNNLKNKFITSDDILITRERHRQHLEQCLEHLKNFNKKNEVEDGNIILKIEHYTNIWADHKRNDLKKIEFFIENDFLPYEILIHFKERVFKLERI